MRSLSVKVASNTITSIIVTAAAWIPINKNMLAVAPSPGDFISISVGVLVLTSAISLVKSVSMKTGLHAFIVHLVRNETNYFMY